MKLLYMIGLASMLAVQASYAQPSTAFRLWAGLGYAKSAGTNAAGGVSFQIEPKYAFTNRLEAGIRLAGGLMARQIDFAFNNRQVISQANGIASALLTGNYYFTDKGGRPFVGVGIGVYSISPTDLPSSIAGQEISKSAVAGGNKFGGMIRTGFTAGHFGLSLDYNILPKTTGTAAVYPGDPFPFTSKSSYLALTIGVVIGSQKGRKQVED